MKLSNTDRVAVAQLPCPYCGASPGSHCRTTPRYEGHGYSRRTRPHSDRLQPIWKAWQIGYTDGTRDLAGMAESLLSAGRTAEQIVERLKAWVR